MLCCQVWSIYTLGCEKVNMIQVRDQAVISSMQVYKAELLSPYPTLKACSTVGDLPVCEYISRGLAPAWLQTLDIAPAMSQKQANHECSDRCPLFGFVESHSDEPSQRLSFPSAMVEVSEAEEPGFPRAGMVTGSTEERQVWKAGHELQPNAGAKCPSQTYTPNSRWLKT